MSTQRDLGIVTPRSSDLVIKIGLTGMDPEERGPCCIGHRELSPHPLKDSKEPNSHGCLLEAMT